MKGRTIGIIALLALALNVGVGSVQAGQLRPSELEKGFTHPPESARPWVYWFWLNGNITSNGITADLEAMKRVGIGGVLIMEVEPGSPAAVGGLHKGDTIVGFKGQPVGSIDDLHKRLIASEIGVPSPVMLLRGTEKLFRMVVPRELRAPVSQ